MEKKVLEKLVYGLFVLTARMDDNDNGCIINTAQQVAYNPDIICIAVNKSSYTHDMILATGKFNISVISQQADAELFGRFGYQTGREVDKFNGFSAWKRSENGISYITEGTNAYISARVFHYVSTNTHTIFMARIEEEAHISGEPSVTYDYYQQNIKQQMGMPPKTEPVGKAVWVCKVCGYVYEGEELPPDFICPICKHPASDFEKVIH